MIFSVRFFSLSIISWMVALWMTVCPATADVISLFNGKDLSGWRIYSKDPNSDPRETWSVQEGVLRCSGKPAGFIHTESEYENYRLRLEWRWPDKGGNSGVLCHIVSDGGAYFNVWPKCIEVQLGHRDAGDFWVIGTDFKEHADPNDRRVVKRHPSNEKPLGEWNEIEILCRGDRIEVTVNGLLQNVATETTVTRGTIGLQSEGTPIEFRNITLEPLCREETETATGIVYADTNGNGKRDPQEKGIAGALVTNQKDVVETDGEGRYFIEVDSDDIISVIKPAGYLYPVDEWYLPRFSYIHKPNGSPKSKFPGVDPTGPLPESIDFGLIPVPKNSRFDIVVFGDPQPTDYREVQYIRDDVIAEMITEPAVRNAVFGVSLGDIMNNDLSLYDPYNQVIAQLRKPWFNVIGNHDLNFDSPVDETSDETWHRVYGPNYYAFFHGEVLFIAIDDVHWKIEDRRDPKTGKIEKKGGYVGLIGQTQLAWIEKVLSYQPADRLVVIMMHIPLAREWGNDVRDAERIYEMLRGRKALLLAGHTHTQEHVFIGKNHSDVLGDQEIHELINVTVCGAWWKGMRDERGIPIAITSDGVDNGYTILSIDGNSYTSRYKAAGKPWDHQIRIHAPVGHVKEDRRVIVNVLAGSSRSQVAYRVDDRPPVSMTRTRMDDPLVRSLWDNRDENLYKAAQKPTHQNTHVWTAELPTDLEPGIHTLTVIEKDLYGNIHRKAGVFIVDK